MPTTPCPKCSGEMAPGFLTAAEGNGAYTYPELWVAGPPERSLWTIVKVKDKEKHTIVAHRCRKCGFVEFYAPEQQS
jgi:predicted nucleic-acid-binding Zn-ribbon protein